MKAPLTLNKIKIKKIKRSYFKPSRAKQKQIFCIFLKSRMPESETNPVSEFVSDSIRFIRKCSKPDYKGIADFFFNSLEFMKIGTATAVGFLVMGFIGFFIKLIHIPINNILLGH